MNRMNKSLMMALLMMFSSVAGIAYAPQAEAAQVVIIEAVQIVDGGSVNDRMVAMASDSEGNIHVVWSRNTQHLYYTMLDPRAQTLISATQISNSGTHRAWHPDVAIDDQDRIHIVWADKSGSHSIKYTLIDPSMSPLDGSPAEDAIISIVDDTIVSQRNQNRDWPAIAIDSTGAVHIVWEDSYEQLGKFYNQPQIYYAMLQIDEISRQALTAIDDTLLTPIIGHKGHPDIAVDADDLVQIVWDDTRGGKVEIVAPIDTSGSMYSEWADMCTVFYGGSFSNGGTFRGIKPMLEEANMTVYETLYALGGYYPSSAGTGSCLRAPVNGQNQAGVRSTALGLVPGDDSGGLRKLTAAIFNGAVKSGGYSGEDWGPGSEWACLSWQDNQGNVPGNPPTTLDHKWNPNATKIVMPISDEGPYGGDPAQQANDIDSINYAHDACVRAGIIPVPMYGSSWGGGINIQSHMKDLAQCPNGQISTGTRICPGSTIRNTDAGGHTYQFPASGGNQMNILVEAMVYLATNNSREIYMTVLDPHAMLDNPSNGWLY
ncbi:MAG: hypothetical protein MK235_05910, partial [Candidatus Poseidoniales archaeon]|nr:hypothetical protein [Candidatus Poseidoniales archaeon]